MYHHSKVDILLFLKSHMLIKTIYLIKSTVKIVILENITT